MSTLARSLSKEELPGTQGVGGIVGVVQGSGFRV